MTATAVLLLEMNPAAIDADRDEHGIDLVERDAGVRGRREAGDQAEGHRLKGSSTQAVVYATPVAAPPLHRHLEACASRRKAGSPKGTIRIDAGVRGATSAIYDPMIAKLITHGKTW